MNIFNRLSRFFSGPHEVRSQQWDAAGAGRLANWRAPIASPNAWMDSPPLVRARAEDAYRNNAYAHKAVDATVAAAVGASGVIPQFKDRAVTEAWNAWSDGVDAAGRLDWNGLVAQVLQSTAVSGECFVVFKVNPAASVPLALQLLPPEFLDVSHQDGQTFAGIQYDGTRRAGYWLYERHPALSPGFMRSVFVPAAECLHIFRPIGPGAERGVSWLAPVLLPLRELQEYLEAERVRAKVASLFAGFVQTGDGSNPLNSTNGVPSLEPGSMVRLQAGEIVEFSKPPDIGTSFDPFVRAALRQIASGMNLPYEVLANDSSPITFASGRHGLLEWRRHIEWIQYGLLVPQLCAPILARWQNMAAALGVIAAPSKVRWIGPQVALLDERAEVVANVAKIRAGLTSRAEVVSMTGWTVEEIDAELAADNARADQLGLVLDSDPRKVTQQGQGQADGSQGA